MSISIIQAVPGGIESSTGPLSLSIASTTPGSCLFLGVLSWNDATAAAPTTVEAGSTPFTLQGTHYAPEDGGILALYAIPDNAGGLTTVTLDQAASTNTTLSAQFLEVGGIVTSSILDQQSAGTATETAAWSSGATSTTTQANELAIGLYGGWQTGTFTPVGPASPWVNEAAVNEVSDSFDTYLILGYNILSSEQAVTYAGTGGTENYWNTAKVWTFFGASTPLQYNGPSFSVAVPALAIPGFEPALPPASLIVSYSGSPSASVSYKLSATGSKKITESVSLGPAKFTFAATGAKKDSGSTTAAVTLKLTATGAKRITESVTAGVAKFASSATGAKQITESASWTADFTATATGKKSIAESASRTATFTLAAVGTSHRTGTATAKINFTETATGTSHRTASAAISTSFVLSASGAKRIAESVAFGPAKLSLSATGKKSVAASATATVTVKLAATGTKSVSASPVFTVNFTATCTGTQPNAPNIYFSLAAYAVGAKRITESVSLGPVKFSATVTGIHHGAGTVSIPATFSLSATGQKRITEAIPLGPATFKLIATGTSRRSASASLSVAFTLSSIGTKRIAESDTIDASFDLAATGTSHRTASATASVKLSVTAVGIHHGNTGNVGSSEKVSLTASALGAKRITESISFGPAKFVLSVAGAKRVTESISFGPANFVLTATGQKRITESVSRTVTFTFTSTGIVAVSGASTAYVSFALSAAGVHKGNTGAVGTTAAVSLHASATGIHHGSNANVTLSPDFVLTAVGAKRITESVSFGPVSFAVLEAIGGKRITESVSFGPVKLSISATGYKSIAESVSLGSIPKFNLTATGAQHGTGSATASLSLKITATGIHHAGSASVSLAPSLTLACTGKKSITKSVTLGPATFTFTSGGGVGALAPYQWSMPGFAITGYFIVSEAGQNRSGTAIVSTLKFALLAVGKKSVAKSVSFGPATFALSAIGKKSITKSVSFGPATFALSGVGGKRITESASLGTAKFSISAVGAKRITESVSFGPAQLKLTATGVKHGIGSAAFAATFTFSAVGKAVISTSLTTVPARPFLPNPFYGYPSVTQWSRILVPPAHMPPGVGSAIGAAAISVGFTFTATGSRTTTGTATAYADIQATASGKSKRSGSATLGPVKFVFGTLRVILDLAGSGEFVNELGGTVTNAGDDNTLGGTLTNDLYGGACAPSSFDTTSGGTNVLSSFDANSGGTLEDTNEYGGTATGESYGGTVTDDNLYSGTAVENNKYGYENLVGWQMEAVNITLGEFNDESLTVTITNNGSAFNLTDYNVQMLLKTAAGVADSDPSTIILSTLTSGVTITDASAGDITVSIPNADLQSLGIGFYRIDVIDSDSLQNTAIYGTVTIRAL